ncbi:MAG: hypothetical protein ACTH5W_12610 [Providencia sp.]
MLQLGGKRGYPNERTLVRDLGSRVLPTTLWREVRSVSTQNNSHYS